MALEDFPLYINADNDIWIEGVSIARTSAATTGGTGSYALYAAGSTVAISTGAVSYSTNSASNNAVWFGVIPSTTVTSTQVTAGSLYDLDVTLSNGSGADDFRRLSLRAKYRGTT